MCAYDTTTVEAQSQDDSLFIRGSKTIDQISFSIHRRHAKLWELNRESILETARFIVGLCPKKQEYETEHSYDPWKRHFHVHGYQELKKGHLPDFSVDIFDQPNQRKMSQFTPCVKITCSTPNKDKARWYQSRVQLIPYVLDWSGIECTISYGEVRLVAEDRHNFKMAKKLVCGKRISSQHTRHFDQDRGMIRASDGENIYIAGRKQPRHLNGYERHKAGVVELRFSSRYLHRRGVRSIEKFIHEAPELFDSGVEFRKIDPEKMVKLGTWLKARPEFRELDRVKAFCRHSRNYWERFVEENSTADGLRKLSRRLQGVLSEGQIKRRISTKISLVTTHHKPHPTPIFSRLQVTFTTKDCTD